MRFRIKRYERIDSTNDVAKKCAKNGESDVCVIADVQTKSRGRFERVWHSPAEGLGFSFVVDITETNASFVHYLTFAAGVCVVQAIKELYAINTIVKWPNDVMHNGKKICGILTETLMGRRTYAIVGIGINVNQTLFSEDISKIATSIKLIRGDDKKYDKYVLLEKVCTVFEKYMDHFEKREYDIILDEWKDVCDMFDKEIVVKTMMGFVHGKALDVDENGNLIIELPSKEIKKIVEGDIVDP